MTTNENTRDALPKAALTTSEVAALTRTRPKSITAALSRDGHFCGLKPIRLPNRRLLWPAEQVAQLLSCA